MSMPPKKKHRRKRQNVKYPCHCEKDRGRMVDKRTWKKHNPNRPLLRSSTAEPTPVEELTSDREDQEAGDLGSYEQDMMDWLSDNPDSGEESSGSAFGISRKKRQRPSKFKKPITAGKGVRAPSGVSDDTDMTTSEEDEPSDQSREEYQEEDDNWGEPPSDPFGDPHAWILLLILKLQSCFRLSKLFTDMIVKLFWQVLTEIDGKRFDEFPKSLY